MPKWKDDGEGTVFISPGHKLILRSRSIAGHFTDAHNADIDALTAERDELQRRLDAVVEYVKAHGWRIQDTECQRTIDDIAEGRDNG